MKKIEIYKYILIEYQGSLQEDIYFKYTNPLYKKMVNNQIINYLLNNKLIIQKLLTICDTRKKN